MVYCDSLLADGKRCRARGRIQWNCQSDYTKAPEWVWVCRVHCPNEGGVWRDGRNVAHTGGILHNGSSKPQTMVAVKPAAAKPACNCLPNLPCLKHVLGVA